MTRISETDAAHLPYWTVERALHVTSDGSVAFVADSSLGSPNSPSQKALLPVDSYFNQYGKCHAVWVSEDNHSYFLSAVFMERHVAEEYADNFPSAYAIITSMSSKNEIQLQITRQAIDEKGHHYMSKDLSAHDPQRDIGF